MPTNADENELLRRRLADLEDVNRALLERLRMTHVQPHPAVRVYVAGASAELPRVAAAIRALRDLPNLAISYDWTLGVSAQHASGHTDADLDLHTQRLIARDDVEYGVASADVVWLLQPAPGAGVGAWVEYGYALGLRACYPHNAKSQRIIVSFAQRDTPRLTPTWPVRSIFVQLADEVVPIDEDVLDMLAKLSENPRVSPHRSDTRD